MSFNHKLKKIVNLIIEFFYKAFPLILATDTNNYLCVGLMMMLIFYGRINFKLILKNFMATWPFFLIIAIFYLFSFIFYEPTIYRRITNLVVLEISLSQFLNLLLATILYTMPLLGLKSSNERLELLYQIILGCALWGITISVFTFINSSPPYYGNALNPLYGHVMNTPGVGYLLLMGILYFFIVIFFIPSDSLISISRIFSLGLATVSLWCAIKIQQRTPFMVAFFVLPILLILLNGIKGRQIDWRYWIGLLTIPIVYISTKSIMEGSFEEYRKVSLGFVNDLRVELYKNWINQVLSDPFIHPSVTYIPNIAHGPPTPWFHNFFMDMARVSGLMGLLSSIVLFVLIFYNLVRGLIQSKSEGKVLVFIFIPLFIILNTAVFPEGELQFFMLLIAIGLISAISNRNIDYKMTHNIY